MKQLDIYLPITLFLVASCGDIEQNLNNPPNIITIISDDLNYTEPSCYGYRWGIGTPAIDKMADEGVRFTNAYSSAPASGPTRAGLVTGRYQTSFGHEFNSPLKEGIGLPLKQKTFANYMKELGYKTGIIGKWHLGGDENCGEEYHPLNRGFDYFFGFHGASVQYFRSDHLFRGKEKVNNPRYLTDIIAEESFNFIENNRKNPFFLYVAFNAVHTPLQANEEDLKFINNMPHFQNFILNLDNTKDTLEVLNYVKTRAAMLVALDRAVGQINN